MMGVTHTSRANEAAEREAERLVAELRRWGIAYVAGGHEPSAPDDAPMQPTELLRRLAACDDARVRDATIALLLLHPTLIPDTASTTAAPSDALVTLLLAATYLQAIWRTRLTLAIGPHPVARYDGWRARGLPAPWRDDGEAGLRALAAYERRRVGRPYNFVAAWAEQVDHLCAQAWSAKRRARKAQEPSAVADAVATRMTATKATSAPKDAAPTQAGARGLWRAPQGGAATGVREPVDKARITLFLTRLGEQTRQPGHLYLVGGTTMVYEGYRRATLDIDLLVEADDPGQIIAAIRDLKNSLDINVKSASPADFIPLPNDWRERSIWVGRFGSLDVFHFDLYSTALSKIERGSERDFQDALALLRDGRIDLETLDQTYNEILPRIQTEGLAGMDPDVFAAHYEELRQMLGAG